MRLFAWTDRLPAFLPLARRVAGVIDEAVPRVEDGPLGADLGQPVEVVRRRRRGGRPLERVALPRVIARELAVPERGEDVPDERQHRGSDQEAADRRGEVPV